MGASALQRGPGQFRGVPHPPPSRWAVTSTRSAWSWAQQQGGQRSRRAGGGPAASRLRVCPGPYRSRWWAAPGASCGSGPAPRAPAALSAGAGRAASGRCTRWPLLSPRLWGYRGSASGPTAGSSAAARHQPRPGRRCCLRGFWPVRPRAPSPPACPRSPPCSLRSGMARGTGVRDGRTMLMGAPHCPAPALLQVHRDLLGG